MVKTSPEKLSKASRHQKLTSRWRRLVNFFKKPFVLFSTGVVISLGVLFYKGTNYFIYHELSFIISSRLSKILERDVKIGLIESFSINSVQIGNSSISAAENSGDYIDIQNATITINFFTFLIKQTLDIDIFLNNSNFYISQDKYGKWAALPELKLQGKLDLPIKIRTNLYLNNANVFVLPNKFENITKFDVNGEWSYTYNSNDYQKINYFINISSLDSEINIEGLTNIKSWKTRAKIIVNKLVLNKLFALGNNLSTQLSNGFLNTDLNFSLPSLKEIEKTKGVGRVEVTNFISTIKNLKSPIDIYLGLEVIGQTLKLNKTKILFGDTITKLEGSINLQKGYDIRINSSYSLTNKFSDFLVNELQPKLYGNIKSEIQLTGKITNPIFTGIIKNSEPLLIKNNFVKNFQIIFKASLNQINLKLLQIQTIGGGDIFAAGVAYINFFSLINGNNFIDWQTAPMLLGLQMNLPVENILSSYYQLPKNLRVGDLKIHGEFKGNIGKPQGKIIWFSPYIIKTTKQQLSGQGIINFDGENISLKDTVLNSDQGNLRLVGIGNTKNKKWSSLIVANQFSFDPLIQLSCTLITCPKNLTIQPITLRKGTIRLTGRLDNFIINSVDSIERLLLVIGNSKIYIKTKFSKKYISGNIFLSDLLLNKYFSFLPTSLEISQSNINFNGSLVNLFQNKISGIRDFNIGGTIQTSLGNNPLTTNIQIRNGILTSFTKANYLFFNSHIPVPILPNQLQTNTSNITITGNIKPFLSSFGTNPNIDSFSGSANIEFFLDNNPIKITGNLDKGTIRGITQISNFSLDNFLADLSVSDHKVKGQIAISSKLLPLIREKPDLTSTEANISLQLIAGKGTVNTITYLKDNKWNSKINVFEFNPILILNNIIPNTLKTNIINLNAQAMLSGDISNLFNKKENLLIKAKNIIIQSKKYKQSLNATGDIFISSIFTKPDMDAYLSLEINSIFDKIDLNQFFPSVSSKIKLLTKELQFKGNGRFKGTLIIKKLLTDILSEGNLQVLGDLILQDFAINEQIFEPLLIGKVNIPLGKNIFVDLEGSEDMIKMSLQPCIQLKCSLPYLPSFFTLLQKFGSETSITIQSKLKRDNIFITVKDLPLNIFNILSSKNYNISNYTSGLLDTKIVINPFTLEGKGKLKIKNPSIDFIETPQLEANIAYKNNIINLQSITLGLKKSLYQAQVSINLISEDISGMLSVKEGQVKDLFATLKIFNIERLLDLFQLKPTDDQNITEKIPESIGNADANIAEQINLLAIIDQEIRDLADKKEKWGVPTELDIRGHFDTNIILGGNLRNPKLDITLTGKNWEWHSQEPYRDVINPLGLIIRRQSFIPINEVLINAKLANDIININPAFIQINGTSLGLDGKFSLQEIDANWQVNYFSIDTIKNFINIPINATGALNASGSIVGNTFNPHLQGKFAFVDAAFQGQSLNSTIEGQFSYENSRFQLLTNESSIIFTSVNIPFTNYEESNEFDINIQLDTEALQLLSIITNEQVFLTSGEGQINAQATGQLDASQGLLLSDLSIGGSIILNETVFQSKMLSQPLTVSGKIKINKQIIDVKEIQGNFADSTLKISGILPLFQPRKNLKNPLIISIDKGEIKLEELYKGIVDGELTITGAAIQPIIGGQIKLINGQIFLPTKIENQEETVAQINQWVKRRSRQNNTNNQFISFIPELQDLQLSLENLFIEVLPLFRFDFGGDVMLSGSLTDFTSVRPEGEITINKGLVNFLDTRFFVERRKDNKIVFVPEKGLLNPSLDIAMRAIVSEVPDTSRNFRTGDTTEIPDDSLSKVQRIDIDLSLDGPLSQLIPNLGKDINQVCQINNLLKPIQNTTHLSERDLETASICLQAITTKGAVGEQLLSNPVINLTSNPPRSQGEIVRLLGEHFLVLAEELQNQNTEQLLQFGIVQLALPMVFQSFIYDLESSVNEVINSADFRLVPFLETIYEVENKGYVRFSYDYALNGFRIKYEKRF